MSAIWEAIYKAYDLLRIPTDKNPNLASTDSSSQTQFETAVTQHSDPSVNPLPKDDNVIVTKSDQTEPQIIKAFEPSENTSAKNRFYDLFRAGERKVDPSNGSDLSGGHENETPFDPKFQSRISSNNYDPWVSPKVVQNQVEGTAGSSKPVVQQNSENLPLWNDEMVSTIFTVAVIILVLFLIFLAVQWYYSSKKAKKNSTLYYADNILRNTQSYLPIGFCGFWCLLAVMAMLKNHNQAFGFIYASLTASNLVYNLMLFATPIFGLILGSWIFSKIKFSYVMLVRIIFVCSLVSCIPMLGLDWPIFKMPAIWIFFIIVSILLLKVDTNMPDDPKDNSDSWDWPCRNILPVLTMIAGLTFLSCCQYYVLYSYFPAPTQLGAENNYSLSLSYLKIFIVLITLFINKRILTVMATACQRRFPLRNGLIRTLTNIVCENFPGIVLRSIFESLPMFVIFIIQTNGYSNAKNMSDILHFPTNLSAFLIFIYFILSYYSSLDSTISVQRNFSNQSKTKSKFTIFKEFAKQNWLYMLCLIGAFISIPFCPSKLLSFSGAGQNGVEINIVGDFMGILTNGSTQHNYLFPIFTNIFMFAATSYTALPAIIFICYSCSFLKSYILSIYCDEFISS